MAELHDLKDGPVIYYNTQFGWIFWHFNFSGLQDDPRYGAPLSYELTMRYDRIEQAHERWKWRAAYLAARSAREWNRLCKELAIRTQEAFDQVTQIRVLVFQGEREDERAPFDTLEEKEGIK